jgi:4-hydroxybenzoate polyprenyltransferase
MAKPLLTKNKAKAISSALFLIGLAIIFFIDSWWPGMMIVIGVPLALKQFLLGRYNDAAMSLFVFVGFFIIAQFNISWKILLPILFVMAAIYVLCKEWVKEETGEENEEGSSTETDTDKK